MQAKKIAGYNVSGVVVLVITIVLRLLSGDDAIIGRLIETALQETHTVVAEDAKENEIITIVVANDGDIIRNSDGVRLAGGIHFRGKKGDRIVLQKQDDGVWLQIGKHLIEMRDFE